MCNLQFRCKREVTETSADVSVQQLHKGFPVSVFVSQQAGSCFHAPPHAYVCVCMRRQGTMTGEGLLIHHQISPSPE